MAILRNMNQSHTVYYRVYRHNNFNVTDHAWRTK